MMMGKQVRETRQNSTQTTTSGQFGPRPFASPEPEHETLDREARFGYSFGEISLFPIQPKLKLGPPGDRYEQEADRVAEQIMRMPEPCPKCRIKSNEENKFRAELITDQITNPLQQEKRDNIQTEQASGQNSQVCPQVEAGIRSLNGSGRPLPKSTRAFFEPRFGTDFSQVRVHTGAKAARLAQAVDARAFTTGRDVVFGKGLYAPESANGRRLLAHELTHVVQQNWNRDSVIQRYTTDERSRCPCLDWSLTRMYIAARAMVAGGALTGKNYASRFMDLFLGRNTGDQYVNFFDFQADSGGRNAIDSANSQLINQFLSEADSLPCGSGFDCVKRVNVPGHFAHGTDLFYAMGGFTLEASGAGTVSKSCDESSRCTSIEADVDIIYRVNDLYDWKADSGGCTPSTGETGCRANTKTATFPVIGTVCDECLNRLVIHGWASEFMVKVRGRASNYRVSGPCGFRNPPVPTNLRDNQRADP